MTTVISGAVQQRSLDALAWAESSLGKVWPQPTFNGELEQIYERSTSGRRCRSIRFWVIFGIVLKLFSILNELALGGELLTYGLIFRFGILAPIGFGALWFITPRYSERVQGIAIIVPAVLGIFLVALLGEIAPLSNVSRYFVLAGVNIAAFNMLVPLRFRHAIVFTLLSLAAYWTVAFSGYGRIEPSAVADIVVLYSLVAIASLAVTLRNEVAEREAFLASERIRLQGDALREANQELQRLLSTDALTGVYNRRHLDEALTKSARAAVAMRDYLGVLMVDVDYFKVYNDLLGHPAGDACLRAVARAISGTVRADTDIVTRYGGEEFAVLAPGLTPAATERLGERIRAAIEALKLPHPRAAGAHVTVSVGVAGGLLVEEPDLDRLIEDADQALYRSKNLGRNRVTLAGQQPAAA
ncbi:MAG: GGDEF domain-containing protein [Hyphomicrobium sp.]